MKRQQRDWIVYRQQSDPLADAAIVSFYEDAPDASWKQAWRQIQWNGEANPKAAPTAFREFLEATQTMPCWADNRQLAKGVALFGRYAQEGLSILGLYSLPYCYAAADGAKVLYASEKIRANPGQRLLDTGDYLMAVLHPKGFSPDQRALRANQKVRLLHATIRYHLQKNQWDSDQLGIPINQTDMAGTNLAFGWLVLQGLMKIGIRISPEEKRAYLHTWKVLGYLMGVDEALLTDDPAEAYRMEREIAEATFAPSQEGKALTQDLVTFFREYSPISGLAKAVEPIMAGFMGAKTAHCLGLPVTEIPKGSLPLLFAPLRLAGGRQRDPLAGYYQASRELTSQRKEILGNK